MKRLPVFIIFILISFFSYSGVLSAVRGEITDSKTKEKIEKVKITIESLRVKNLKYTVFTNKKGIVYKSGLQPGVYSITYEKKGYIPRRRVIRIGISETEDIGISLDPIEEVKELPENEIKKALNTFEKGDYEEAIKRFSNLLEKEKNNPVYYFYIALSYEKLNDTDKAIEFYRKSLSIKPDFTFSLQKLGTLYAKKSEFKKAIEYYERAIKGGEADADTYYNLGVCYINTGDNKNAKKAMEKAVELDPNYSDAYYQLGLIYLGLGNIDKAKEYLSKFIKMDPDNKNIPTAKAILKNLK